MNKKIESVCHICSWSDNGFELSVNLSGTFKGDVNETELFFVVAKYLAKQLDLTNRTFHVTQNELLLTDIWDIEEAVAMKLSTKYGDEVKMESLRITLPVNVYKYKTRYLVTNSGRRWYLPVKVKMYYQGVRNDELFARYALDLINEKWDVNNLVGKYDNPQHSYINDGVIYLKDLKDNGFDMDRIENIVVLSRSLELFEDVETISKEVIKHATNNVKLAQADFVCLLSIFFGLIGYCGFNIDDHIDKMLESNRLHLYDRWECTRVKFSCFSMWILYAIISFMSALLIMSYGSSDNAMVIALIMLVSTIVSGPIPIMFACVIHG